MAPRKKTTRKKSAAGRKKSTAGRKKSTPARKYGRKSGKKVERAMREMKAGKLNPAGPAARSQAASRRLPSV